MQTIFLYEVYLHPAKGYELSIYNEVPTIGWLFFLSSIFICYFLIFNSIESTQKYSFEIGFLLLILANFLFLIMPMLKGYVAYGSLDSFTHIGYIKDLISTGHISHENIYPIIHILASIIVITLNMDPMKTINLLPAVGTIAFIVSSLILSKLFFGGKIFKYSAIISSFLVFGTIQTMLYPHIFSIELTPFLFYFILKAKYTNNNNNLNFALLMIIYLILFPFLYPLTSLILIPVILLVEYFISVSKTNNKIFNLNNLAHLNKNTAIISGIIFFAWFSTFSIFDRSIKRVWDGIFIKEHIQLEKGLNTLSTISLDTKIELGLKIYADNIIIIILASLSAVYIFKKYIKSKEVKLEFIPAFLFIFSFIIIILIFISIESQSLFRAINSGYYIIFAPILCGHTLMRFYNYIQIKSMVLKNASFAISILIIAIISFAGVYHSPYILHPSLDISNEYYDGTKWFLDEWNTSKTVIPIGIIQSFHYAIVGFENQRIQYSNIQILNETAVNKEITLDSAKDSYILINYIFIANSNDENLYNNSIDFPPIFMKHTKIKAINDNLNVDKIYENGEFIVLVS